MFRRFVAAVALVATAVFAPVAALSVSDVGNPAVTRLWGSTGYPNCTAFYLQPAPRKFLLEPRAVVLSAGHCAPGANEIGRGQTRAVVDWRQVSFTYCFFFGVCVEAPDYALGVVDDLRSERTFLSLAVKDPEEGDRLWVHGFGYGVEQVVVLRVVAKDEKEHQESYTLEVEGYPRIHLNRGMSGSPVLDRYGKVVGLLWGGDPYKNEGDTKRMLITPVSVLREHLRLSK